MAIAHDTVTRFPSTDGPSGTNSVDTTTGDRTFSHAAASGATGATVIVFSAAATAPVSGVLYGGVQMDGTTTVSETSEDGWVGAFHLVGASFPGGTQTITLEDCTADSKWATCFSVTTASGKAALVEDTSIVGQTISANPQVTMTTTRDTMAYAGIHSGAAAPATTAFTGVTYERRNDYGSKSANAVRMTNVQTTSGYAIGCTLASEDWCMVAIAFSEDAGGAIVATAATATFSMPNSQTKVVLTETSGSATFSLPDSQTKVTNISTTASTTFSAANSQTLASITETSGTATFSLPDSQTNVTAQPNSLTATFSMPDSQTLVSIVEVSGSATFSAADPTIPDGTITATPGSASFSAPDSNSAVIQEGAAGSFTASAPNSQTLEVVTATSGSATFSTADSQAAVVNVAIPGTATFSLPDHFLSQAVIGISATVVFDAAAPTTNIPADPVVVQGARIRRRRI